jgi:hypothetical protein
VSWRAGASFLLHRNINVISRFYLSHFHRLPDNSGAVERCLRRGMATRITLPHRTSLAMARDFC